MCVVRSCTICAIVQVSLRVLKKNFPHVKPQLFQLLNNDRLEVKKAALVAFFVALK
jgi:hypothetical protein